MFRRRSIKMRQTPLRIDKGTAKNSAVFRKGGALIEFVFVLPVLFLVILGSVDVCNNIFTKQFLTEVSYQGAMEGSDSAVLEADLVTSIQAYLTARNVGTATITAQGTDGTAFDFVQRGEMFEIIIDVAAADRESPPVIVQFVDLSARSVGVRQ